MAWKPSENDGRARLYQLHQRREALDRQPTHLANAGRSSRARAKAAQARLYWPRHAPCVETMGGEKRGGDLGERESYVSTRERVKGQ